MQTEVEPVRKGSTSKKSPMVKTLLEFYWTFWYVYKSPNKNKTSNYNSVLKKIFTIDCIEDFWNVYNNMPLCDALLPNADFMFFKSDVKPEWEDAKNKKGGKWVITIEKSQAKEISL